MIHTASPAGRTPLPAGLRLAVLFLLLCGCVRQAPLPVSRSFPLEGELAGASSLAVEGGRLWVAGGDRLAALDAAAGGVLLSVELEADAARIAAVREGTVYLVTPSGVAAVDAEEGRVRARSAGVEDVALDPGGEVAYLLAPRGGVLGADAETLRPLWGWPERGPEGTALAVSPLGDRVYQALEGDPPRILVRDAQTGRILDVEEVPGPVRSLAVGADGVLYAATGEGWWSGVLALRPGPGGVEAVWRIRVPEGPLRVRVSPAGDRLAVLAPAEGVLRLLDARTGEVVAEREGVVDAAFAPRGALYLLRGGGVREEPPTGLSARGPPLPP